MKQIVKEIIDKDVEFQNIIKELIDNETVQKMKT